MAKNKQPTSTEAYGTRLTSPAIRSNHPVKSRYLAAVLAMLLGILGVNQFYLRNIVRGILKILLTVIFVVLDFLFSPPLILVPVALSVITGVIYLCQSDASFQKRNHVRTI